MDALIIGMTAGTIIIGIFIPIIVTYLMLGLLQWVIDLIQDKVIERKGEKR